MTQPDALRVLITGSRTWHDNRIVHQAIRRVLHETAPGRPIVFIHGACKTGADAIADCYLRYIGADVERHPAEWHRLGKRAGPVRNIAMVSSGASICLAFLAECQKPDCIDLRPNHWSHGAAGTVELAKAARIPVRPYEQTGGERDAA